MKKEENEIINGYNEIEKRKEEQKIFEILKEVIKPDDMKEIKKARKEELSKRGKELEKEELEEWKTLNKPNGVKNLVLNNYSVNYLIDIKEKKKVLVMGINPGGGTKIEGGLNTNQKLLCINVDENEEDENKDLLDKLKDCEIIYQNYHYKNYNIFKKIDGKLFWSSDKFFKESKEILKQKLNEEQVKKLNNLYTKEQRKDKKAPYVVYGDLFYYADGNQNNIRNSIDKFINKGIEKNARSKEKKKNNEKIKENNKKDLNEKVREILDIHINFYTPRMIVITNAFASDLIKDALKEKIKIIGEDGIPEKIENNSDDYDAIEYRKIPIILSGMVSGGHSLDKYSYIRLQRRIEKIYKVYWEEK